MIGISNNNNLMANNKYSCLSTVYIIYNTIEIHITNIIKLKQLLSDLN